jgi:hypothetical protein
MNDSFIFCYYCGNECKKGFIHNYRIMKSIKKLKKKYGLENAIIITHNRIREMQGCDVKIIKNKKGKGGLKNE